MFAPVRITDVAPARPSRDYWHYYSGGAALRANRFIPIQTSPEAAKALGLFSLSFTDFETTAPPSFDRKSTHATHSDLRHDPARRQSGRRRQLFAAGQAADHRTARQPGFRLRRRRLSGLERKRHPILSARCRPSTCEHAKVCAFGMTRPPRRDGRGRPRPAGFARRPNTE